MRLSTETLNFIKTAPPEWSASQVLWDIGVQFLDEHKHSAKALKKMQSDAGWLTLMAVKRHVDADLEAWMKRDIEQLRESIIGVSKCRF